MGDSWSKGDGVDESSEAGSPGTIRPADAVFVSLGANDFVDGELPDGFASAYASGVETHALMAENTIAFLRAELGW